MYYKITLTDGTVLENILRNGTTFETTEAITEDIFEDNLGHVVLAYISDDMETEEAEEFDNVELVRLWVQDGTTCFVLRALTKAELDQIQNRADIEYIAMMADIDLD